MWGWDPTGSFAGGSHGLKLRVLQQTSPETSHGLVGIKSGQKKIQSTNITIIEIDSELDLQDLLNQGGGVISC